VCEDCFDLGCPAGQFCEPGSLSVGTCVDDPCADATGTPIMCPAGQFCAGDTDGDGDGDCVSNVCDPPCDAEHVCDPTTLECVEACNDAFCMNVVCTEGERCDPRIGRCAADPCTTVTCNPGQVQTLVCTPGELLCTCADPPEPPEELVLATGGGGCACRVESRSGDLGGAATGLGLFGLVLVFIYRRRRRRR
jgi:hypothetical protein